MGHTDPRILQGATFLQQQGVSANDVYYRFSPLYQQAETPFEL